MILGMFSLGMCSFAVSFYKDAVCAKVGGGDDQSTCKTMTDYARPAALIVCCFAILYGCFTMATTGGRGMMGGGGYGGYGGYGGGYGGFF
jgi:hypothetical protein